MDLSCGVSCRAPVTIEIYAAARETKNKVKPKGKTGTVVKMNNLAQDI